MATIQVTSNTATFWQWIKSIGMPNLDNHDELQNQIHEKIQESIQIFNSMKKRECDNGINSKIDNS